MRFTTWLAMVACGADSVTVTHAEFPGQEKLSGNDSVTVATVPTGIVLMFMPTIIILPPLALADLFTLSERTVMPDVAMFVEIVH